MKQSDRQNSQSQDGRSANDERVGIAARWLLPSIGSFCLLIVLYLLIFNSGRFLLDSDTGWHIRTGELVLENGAAPRQDPFSHTMAGREWFAWEWLTDVAMAVLHNRLGLGGIVAGAFLVLLAGYAALYQLMISRGSDAIVAFVVTVFAALGGIVHWLARPHLVSIALMVVWYAAVESYRRRRSRWIFIAPLLIALWANLHGAFVATFVVLAVYAAGEFLEFATRGDWRSRELRVVLKTYGLVGLLSAVAALVTPYGAKLYGHLWRYLTDSNLLASIDEFQSPNFHSTDGRLIEIMLLFGAIAAANALRRGKFVETGLLIIWGHMTLQSERHVTLALVMIAPIIAEESSRLIAESIDRFALGKETSARAVRAIRSWYRETMAINGRLTGGFVYAAVLIFVILLPASGMAGKLLSPRFNPNRFPVEAAEYILEKRPEGRMYSSDQFGGYLIYRLYPQFKVFVDGRSDFYRQGTVLEDFDQIALVKPRWSELLDRYAVQWMVLRRNEPLALIALVSGRWQKVYEDSVAQVLIRNSAQTDQAENSPVSAGRP
jgi:hypothetical protein